MAYGGILKGVVAACERRGNQQGVPMKYFELVDHKNKSVEIKAYGRHGENELIANGNEIVIFIVSGLGNTGTTKGTLWVYDKAHVCLCRTKCFVPPDRNHIELSSS